MSDFFIQNPEDEEQDYTTTVKKPDTQVNQNPKDYNQIIQDYKTKKRQHYADAEEYGVELPDGYYDAFRPMLANCETQEERQELAYKIGTAAKYSELTGEPLLDAFENVDAYNKANFPNLQNQKGWYEATKDMIAIGNNNVKLGNLGQQLMKAHLEGDEELAAALMAEIDSINQRNETLQQHVPDRWWKEAVEAGATSIPFTGAVAGAGIVGNFLSPAVGKLAATTTSSYLMAGQEYIDMLANGSTPETARKVAKVSGIIQGLIESDFGITKGILKGSARLMGKEAGEKAAKRALNEIGSKFYKRFHFGPGKKIVTNFIYNYGKGIFDEGKEEALQNVVSVLGKELAAAMDGYDIPEDDLKSIISETMDQFKGGMLGAVFLGIGPAGLNAAADVAEYAKVKKDAQTIESEEALKNKIKNSPLFKGMSEENRDDVIHDIFEKEQQRKEEAMTAKAKQIAEGLDAGEGAEERKVTVDENGNEVEEETAEAVARDEKGRLFVQDEEYKNDEGKVTGGKYWAGNANVSGREEGNRYGYITYSQAENGDITIDTFKMTDGREGLRQELFDQFAQEHPDVKIEWNAIGSDTQTFKQQLIDNNPSGAKNGLNYYTTEDLNTIQADKRLASIIRDKFHNFKYDDNGNLIQTDFTTEQTATGVTLFNLMAKNLNVSVDELLNQFVPEVVRGSEELGKAIDAHNQEVTKEEQQNKKFVTGAFKWTEVEQGVKAVIYAGEYADFSTLVHELAHFYQSMLTGDLKKEAEKAFNVVKGDWQHSKYTFADGRTMSSKEAFAYALQDYLTTGKAENKQMQTVLQRFVKFLADAYNRLRKSLTFTPEIENVFNKLLDGDDTIMSKALKAAEEEDKEWRANLQRQVEVAESTKKAEAEEAQKQAALEKEEASEYTDYEQETTQPSAEEIEKQLEESNEKETGNAIDDALENTNFTDEQKAKVSEVLKDETSTIAEKADAIVDAAGEQFDLFQSREILAFQLAGEPSIRRMAESEERTRILNNLEKAKELDEKYGNVSQESKAAAIRRMTGWEKDATGKWKYELDDSINRIKSSKMLDTILKQKPEIAVIASQRRLLNLGDIYDAPELYKVFPYMKNVRVSFYLDNNAFRSVLTGDGIKINARYLMGIKSEKGLKGALVHEIQHVIQTLEYAESNGIHGADIEELYNEMKAAIQAVGQHNTDYDFTSVENALQNYMENEGEIEARNVARRVLMNADERLYNTLASTEDVKRDTELLFQNTPEEIQAAETYLDTFKSAEKKRVKNNLEKFKDTSWYNVTIKSLNARSDINALLDAKELADDSILKHEAVKTYYEVLTAGDTKQERINNLYEYFDCKSSLIGNPSKPLNSVASSFINCNPSKECAQFCYAANGRNQMINLIVNRELVNWCIEHDPARSAKMVAEEYKVTREYKNGVALRLLDTGDLSAPWLDFIKELNDRGVSCQIFSKRPDLLKQVDREKNVILLSIDNSNTEVAKKYPDMPIAYVYSGVQDLEYIKNNEERFKKYNGVILPVVMNRKRLSPKEIDALPAWSKNYTCPIDAGWKEIGNNQERKYNKNKWNCSVCDINGQGCFFARAVKDRKKFYATLKEVPIGVLNAITEEYEKLAKSKLADLGLSESDIGSILTEMVNIRNQKLAGIDTEGTDTGLPGNGGILQEAPGETEGLGSQNGSQKKSKVKKDTDLLFQIAGEIGAKNLDNSETQEGVSRMQNLAIAKDMEADGKDVKAIRLATGWEKGDDGYWRYELDDSNVSIDLYGGMKAWERFHPEYRELSNKLYNGEQLTEEEQGRLQELSEVYYLKQEKRAEEKHFTLEDVIDFPELFRAYPTLQGIDVYIEPSMGDGTLGEYDPIADAITIFKNPGEKSLIEWEKQTKSVLLHEIQHAIQYIEGFAKGGSPEQFEKQIITASPLISKQKELSHKLNVFYDDVSKSEKKEIYDLAKTLEIDEWWNKKLEVMAKYHGDEVYKLNDQIQELQDQIDEIRENALEGQVKVDNNIYNDTFEAYKSLGGEVESRNVQTRQTLTQNQRIETLIRETEDVAPEDKILLFQTVYHGSGANFDKFDTENYGLTGEGSMSFGYGTYLSGSEEIARDYAERQRPSGVEGWTYKGRPINSYENAFYLKEVRSFLIRNDDSVEKAIEEIEQLKRMYEYGKKDVAYTARIEDFKKYLTILKDKNFNVNDFEKYDKTNLYTADIPDNGYIVWDKDVDSKTKKYVEDAIFKKLTTEPNEDGDYVYKGAERELREELHSTFGADIDGQSLYNDVVVYLGDEKAASIFLNNLGFVGIEYPAYSNFGNAMGKTARNFVIFNDDDIKIIDHLLFQTNAELMQEAQGFESWQDFMEFCEVMHSDDEISPIPSEADAQWYQSFWETSHGLQTEQEKNEQAVQEKNAKDTTTAKAMDALFVTYIRQNPEMLDDFLHEAARIDAIDLDSDEWRNVEDDMDAAQRDKIDQLKDAIGIIMSDYNWQSAMNRVQGGGEISEGMRKRLMGEMTDTFKSRDFRALYAEVMEDPQYAVDEQDTTSAMLSKKLQKYQKRYYDIVKPGEDIARMSPEKRKRIAEQMANRDIANKISNGTLKLNDDLDSYIKSLNAQIKEKQKQYDELDRDTKADYQRESDWQTRQLLKLHDELLMAKSKVTQKNSDIARKINKGLKLTEKYRRESQNLTANYDMIFRKFNDLKNGIQITAEVQAALDRQEQVANVREDLNAKQKEKNYTAEVKKMRINLIKGVLRRVPFKRIDFDSAKTIIAIQRMIEPNLMGGVNRFIGIDSPFLRGVISQVVTDSEYKEKLLNYLNKNSRASEAFVNFKKKLTEMKSIKDFDSWTAKERKAAIKYLPKENWIRDLNLKELAKEREESIDLDIDTEEYSRPVYDENGKPKTYKDADGIEHNVTETAFRLRYSDELGQLVKDAVGADMFDRIVNRPFSEWITEELEQLAQRIDELYTEGRDLLAAKNEARKREAEAIRKRVEDAIKDTGIVINDDDTPEEKERKQKEINKILNLNSGLKGTEAGNEKGIKATLDRLIHGYEDMNVLRFARMLDNQSDGENVYMLYRREDECYNNKTRSINNRARAINEIMKANKITEGDLARSIPVPSVNTEFTVDELLYFLAADKDYAEDEVKLAKGLFGLDANDDWAATSRNAVMFGNMMSDTASQEQKEEWDELDKQMKDAIENDTLTTEQKQLKALGQLDEHPGTSAYIAYCHAKWEAVLAAANSFLEENPKYVALMEAIEADYASQYERMNEVSITEFNQPVHRVRAYVPLVRREQNGEANVNQVKEDLLATFGSDAGKQWVNKGMTQRRVNISPLHQKPVQTGLFATWGSSVDRTEHFIAYAPYVRQLNAVYKSRDAAYTRRFLESRYGKYAVQYLDKYINEVANPNAGKMREAGSEWLHALRGKTAPAYLGWKFSAIIKQGLTSPWPYMQFVNPAEYASAALECTRKGTYDAIREKSVFMNNRVMDPMNELIEEMADEGKTKFDRALGKFGKKGMAGLEWIDWVCVAPGWLACYKKEYARLQRASEARYDAKMEELRERNMYADIATSQYMTPDQMEAQARKEIMEDIEVEAVRYADDCTRQCQPSSRAADLAPLFKNSSEAMKAFLQFQTSLNVIWQNIRYDMPYAVRNKQFQRIVGTILGYVFAGIFMNSVMEGVTSGAKDDDDKDLQALRNLIFYSTTQFTDAVPIMGSELTNMMDQMITGKRGFMNSGTDMTPSATKMLSAFTNATKGNWKKAAELSAEAIGMAAGAPVSGTKEVYKLLGKPLENGDVNLKRGLSDVYGIAGDIIEE